MRSAERGVRNGRSGIFLTPHSALRIPRFARRACIEHFGDVRVVHQRQRLPFGLEAGDDLFGVHAGLDDLQRHLPSHRSFLLGHENDTEAPLADLLAPLVRPDDRTNAFVDSRSFDGVCPAGRR